jgi:hypothetical protein|tara:strand:- start:119 stop:334 length:216 start_codon:yes stop_codon:yes gene_type:complete
MKTKKGEFEYSKFVNDFIVIVSQEGLPESHPEFFTDFLKEDHESLSDLKKKVSFKKLKRKGRAPEPDKYCE